MGSGGGSSDVVPHHTHGLAERRYARWRRSRDGLTSLHPGQGSTSLKTAPSQNRADREAPHVRPVIGFANSTNEPGLSPDVMPS